MKKARNRYSEKKERIKREANSKEMRRTMQETRKEKGKQKKQEIDATVTGQIPLAANAGRTRLHDSNYVQDKDRT
jgi:hypothetical protein